MLQNSQIPITRSSRKTLCILIDSKAQIVIKAPHKMPISKIAEFVEKKQNWIKKVVENKKQKILNEQKTQQNLLQNNQIYI